MTTLLSDPYYSASHEVFRLATNQTELMLDGLVEHVGRRTKLRVCSVGSGAGLFELPMLARLRDEGIEVARFVGVDVSEHACGVLERKLESAGYEGLEFELVVAPFQDYETSHRFDVVLFNHVLEYFHGDALAAILQSQDLLEPDGAVVVFSPIRGGINGPYENVYTEFVGIAPIFAGDIRRSLDEAGISYTAELMTAACDVSPLDRDDEDEQRMMLLSFLTQRDCRTVSKSVRDRYADYFRTLRTPGSATIPHPAMLFVL